MISVIPRSRLWAWAGWLVAGLMLFGILSLLVLSSASFNAPAMMALPTASPAAGFAPPVEEGGGRGGDFFDSSSAAQPTAESQNGNAAQERLIIRNGSIALEVEDTRAAQAAVEGMVADMAGEGAFVVSSNEFGGQGERLPAISMAIRI